MTISIGLRLRLRREPVAVLPPSSPPRWWICHDRYRYDYDDRQRERSKGWAYNAAGTGLAREVTRINNKSMPEVYRVDPDHSFPLPPAYLDLLADINPHLPRDKALSILSKGIAFCNTGFGIIDHPRICGGWSVTGTPRDGKLWLKTLRVDQPAPSAADVLADPSLWGWCTGVQPDGDINLIRRNDEHGQSHPVRMFVIAKMPVYVPLDEVMPLPAGFVPAPQWMPG